MNRPNQADDDCQRGRTMSSERTEPQSIEPSEAISLTLQENPSENTSAERLSRDNELAAVHLSGRKLYAPLWKNGEIVPTALPLAAVSIDNAGTTFPKGSFWLRNERGALK